MRVSQYSPVSPEKVRNRRNPNRSSSSGSDRFRTRKKQKRLDNICEKEYTRNRAIEIESNRENDGGGSGSVDLEPELLRRSSRVRRAPVVLDASPSPVKKRRKIDNSGVNLSKKNDGFVERKDGEERLEKPLQVSNYDESEEQGSWRLRLRSRVDNASLALKKKGSSPHGKRKLFDESDGIGEELKVIDGEIGAKRGGYEKGKSTLVKSKSISGSGKAKGSVGATKEDQSIGLSNGNEDENKTNVEEMLLHSDEEDGVILKSAMDDGNDRVVVDDSSIQVIETEESKMVDNLQLDEEQSGSKGLEALEQSDRLLEQSEHEKGGNCLDTNIVVADGGSHGSNNACHDKLVCKPSEDENVIKVVESKQFSTSTLDKPPRVREGRRCGLCRRGTDGKPPKRLVRDFAESDGEAYGGSSSSEEANYDIWDGFGDEPGWLGRLLGPIHDRFGIADVWVHQHCAVWSPEVYFAGLGCLKNVRAALCRGRALKCSRCGRPGATIGCRVDRCPKTYHLPCGRADGCIFDHRKFLIACIDHRHLFQPQGDHYLHRLKKLKAKKMKLEIRKLSHDAWRKDFEAEEKWLENCGEDEEFLKREGKRLNRDIMRIAPVYIGGSSSGNEKPCQGWESVAGLQDVIQCMKEVVMLPLLYPEFFSSLGLTPPRGVLLHGYPGTGKTLIVRALISSCARGDKRIAYFARKGADCLGKYVGDAERQLRLLFQVAERSQPSIIFFDEIDGLAPCRTRQQDQTHNSVVSTLLALMDGLKSRGSVMVIGATNRPEAIDPALRRPGRFDREIYFPLPSVDDRAAILALHTQRWPKPLSGSLLKWIARQTAGFAGADLQALCTQAAMVALKRSCALQELMSAVEKNTSNGSRPSLPSFHVEERDWLDALAHAPPPCSRREAGMAANDVVSSPLHTHLIPCLLQPLSRLLVSLYLDERIWLPASLYRAAKLIKNVIVSALEKLKMSSDFWWSHLPDLIQEAEVARKIARNLSCAGLVIVPSSFADCDALVDDTDVGNEKFERFKISHAGAHASLLQNKTSGFRVLISGCPKSGQQHLAACLLQGFVGCVEIQKVNLATISQEGHGDVVEGMTHILLKCASKGLCLIYMPRIDLWAMETQHQVDEKESYISEKTCKSADTDPLHDSQKPASRAWNSFIEQVDSMCLPASLMILATSELPSQDLPLRIGQFFTSDVLNCNDSAPSEHTVPRLLVQIDGNFSCDTVIDSSATELLWGLVQQYVQMIHHRAHTPKEYKICDATKGNPTIELHNTSNGATSDCPEPVISRRTTSNGDASCNGNKVPEHINGDVQCPPILKTSDCQEDGFRQRYPQDSVPIIHSTNRNVKGKSSLLLAISTFGYQILRYPHFAELCWVTSKLKEGPFTDINGPWKGWPFNACIIRPNNSSEKLPVGCSSDNLKNKEYSGVVRGLMAVGMLAYKGLYTSVRDVSFEVHKVLELLVGWVNGKILGGRDRHQFLRLLSQVAFLEDMVNSWAYTLRSLERDSQVPLSNPGAMIGFPDNYDASKGSPVGSNACKPNISQKGSHEVNVPEHSSQRLETDNSEFVDSNKGVANLGLANSEVRLTISKDPFQQMASLVHSSPGLHFQSSSSTVDPLASENTLNEQNKTNHIAMCGLVVKESVLPSGDGVCIHDGSVGIMNLSARKVSYQCNGLSTADIGLPSEGGVPNPEEIVDVNFTLNKNSNVLAASGVTCLYSCCSDCLHAVYVLIRKILIHKRETIGSCWTVEDAHDVVASCSVSLLSAVREICVAENINNSEFFDGKLKEENHGKFCACPGMELFQLKEANQYKNSGNRVVVPTECNFHSDSKNVTARTSAFMDSEVGLGLNFLFKDNVLISSDLVKDVLFHCKFEKLCLGSLIQILMIKQHLD